MKFYIMKAILVAQFENNYPCQNQEYANKSCDINSVVKQCYSDEKCSEHANSRPYRIRCSYRDLLLGKVQKISAQPHCHDCKNQPNNFCTRDRRHFHTEWPAHFKKGGNYEVHPTHRYSFSSQIVLSFPSLKMMPISSNVFLILSAKSQFFAALAFARISITLSINA